MAQTAQTEIGIPKVVGKSYDYNGINPNKPIMSNSSKAMLGPNKKQNHLQPHSR